MSYERPAIAIVGTVRGLTFRPIQSCKYGWGADDTMPSQGPGLGDSSGQWKKNAPPGCFVS